jgi:hypothetical protein
MLDDLGFAMARREWTTAHPRMRMDLFSGPRLAQMEAEARAQRKPLQHSRLDLVTRVIIGKASLHEPVTLYASLEGSEISSGPMLHDTPCRKGYFQTKVSVGLYLTDSRGNRRCDFRRAADGPDAVDGTAATPSCVSFPFSKSLSLNDGFFGGRSGGGATGSLGLFSAICFARDLRGFRTVNHRPEHGARHEYILSTTSGGSYAEPRDMVGSSGQIGLFGRGAGLHNPPRLATGSLPLVSHCVWKADHNSHIDETIYLNIDVTQTVTSVSTGGGATESQPQAETITLTYRIEEPVPLGALLTA